MKKRQFVKIIKKDKVLNPFRKTSKELWDQHKSVIKHKSVINRKRFNSKKIKCEWL